jgi:hypothetical protein
MKWIYCRNCTAQIPVASNDNPNEWEKGCEVCGSRDWGFEPARSETGDVASVDIEFSGETLEDIRRFELAGKLFEFKITIKEIKE